MSDFDSRLATKLGQNGSATARRTVAKAKSSMAAGIDAPAPIPEPVSLPVEVHEADRKPKQAKTVITSGVSKRSGKPYFMIVAAPGYAIARVILTDLDRDSKRCRTAIIAERRRGRPANSQRGGK